MKFSLYAAAAALALAAPVLAEDSDKVLVEQTRAKIITARADPLTAANGGALLDRAEASLKDLAQTLDDNEASEARSVSAEIDTLIATAKLRGKIAQAKERNARLAAAPPAPQVVVVERPAAPAPAPVFRDGATLVLSDVVFATGRAELKPGADARLRPMIAHLRSNPGVRVKIAGHTDAQGSDTYNQALSQRRAEAVRRRIAAAGIDASRIEATGFGEAQPVAPNDNAAGRQQNRRVEITLVGEADEVAVR